MSSGGRTFRIGILDLLFFTSSVAFCAGPEVDVVQDKKEAIQKQEFVIEPLSPFLLERGISLLKLEKDVREASGDTDDACTYLKPDTAKKSIWRII